MIAMAAALGGLLLQGSAAAAPAAEAWILTCAMPRREAPNDQRVFRISSQVFQEWSPSAKAFGGAAAGAVDAAATAAVASAGAQAAATAADDDDD